MDVGPRVDDTRRMRSARTVALACLVVAVAACSTYRDQLAHGQRAFEVNEHERALALLRDLETDLSRLDTPERARYCYLRGMSDYRLGYRADARHWLALAKTYDDGSPGVLPADWKSRTTEALEEMNAVVYEKGTAALTRKDPEEGASREGALESKTKTPKP
jgi:hypothetical protein